MRPDFNKITTDLTSIISLIEAQRIMDQNGALEKFSAHISEVVEIGRFSSKSWDYRWREKVYEFGSKFKNINPIDFLNILTEAKQNLNKDKQEVLDFYYSEIEANSLPETSCTIRIESYVIKYPYNPEFRHTFGHFYITKKDYLNAIEHYRFAFEKDMGNSTFATSLFNCYLTYFDTLIERAEYDKGLKLCDELISEKIFSKSPLFNNHLISIKTRYTDYLILNKKIKDAEDEIKKIVATETNQGQLKIIEILGFFTAIIAFVFSTITVGKKFSFREAIVFNISLGATLLIFALIISLLFSRKNVALRDFRIMLSLVLILFLVFLVLAA